MTSFEKPDSADENQSEQNHPAENNSDEFLIDEDLLEVQNQLELDANHLVSMYPPADSQQLDDLVKRCTVVAGQSMHLADQKTAGSGKVDPSKSRKSSERIFNYQRWLQAATALCVGFLLVGSFTYLWNQPGLDKNDQPVVSNHSQPDLTLVPAVSVSTLPPEFLNASQPELEAIYDEMPSESLTVEF